MSVFKKQRKDGSYAWYYDFMCNHRRYRGVGGTTKTQALRAQEKIREKVLSGEYELVVETKDPRIDDFSKIFLARRKHMRSWSRDDLSVRTLLRIFKGRNLSTIKPSDIEDYISLRKAANVSNATINRELACLKVMYNQAIKWGDARKNPVTAIDFLEEPPGRTRFLSKEEAQKLISAAADHFRPILITALNTGMRHGEIVNLTWEQVHITNVIDPYIELAVTKNNKKRFVPLNDIMISMLEDLREKYNGSEYVFLSTRKNKLYRTTKPFKSALKKAAINNFRFHDLRHTFASHFIMSGGDLLTLKEILGHSSMKMVERYAHLASAHKRKQVNNLNAVFGKDETEKEDDGLKEAI